MNDNQTQKKANVPTKGNVPALRFPEFSGEWSHGKLSDYLAVHPERNNNSEFSKEEVLSVSGDSGVVNQIELLGRSFAGKDVSNYHVVRKGNIIYTKSPLKEFPYGIVKMNKGDDGIVSTLYAVYDVEPTSRGEFIEQYFAYAPRANRYFKPIVRIGAKHDMKIGNDEVLDNVVVFPSISEQNKIADFLNIIDGRISIQNKIIEDLKKLKTAIRDVIFTAVRNVNDKTEFVSDLLSYEQPTNYIVESTEYSDNASLTPVLTANKGFILGYTPETFGIYRKGECIIFDDFTMDSKFVDFPFKVKSSAMKILTVKADVDLRFMFEYLQSFDLHSEEHKRHYISEVETMEVSVPEYERQQQIGKILACIQGKIDNEISIKMALLRQKNCLLSTMFI